MKNIQKYVLGLAGLLIVVGLTAELDRVPAPWWDEGWTLSVARNWVDLGHYGRLLMDEPVSRGLEFAFPVTGAVALSFWIFGVGIYQARMVAVIYTLAAFTLSFELNQRLYNRRIAIASLLVLTLMGAHVDINSIVMGRQVLGEVPALCFVLAGYLCLILAEKRPLVFMPVAVLFSSLGLFTKIQARPFWVIALSSAIALSLIRRQWRSATLFGTALFGSLALYFFWQYLSLKLSPFSDVYGLTQIIALNLLKQVRIGALYSTLQFGLPTLLGLCWGLWTFLTSKSLGEKHIDLVRFSFLVLAGSWFAWFVTLSVGWPRYMFPSVFLGSVFVAAMLDDWTNHFNLASTIERAGTALRKIHFDRRNFNALVATVLIAMSLGQTITVLYRAFLVDADTSMKATLDFLNTATRTEALIETYESELFFLLRRRYHYPPDQVHVELNRRNSLGEQVKIDYDPMAVNPQYLVIGHQSKFWEFYDLYLNTGNFRLLVKYPRYDIYQRVQ